MKHNLINLMLSAIFSGSGKRPDPGHIAATRAKLLTSPQWSFCARHRGNARRLAAHRQSCLQAYHAKRRLVEAGKGNHTLKGLPA